MNSAKKVLLCIPRSENKGYSLYSSSWDKWCLCKHCSITSNNSSAATMAEVPNKDSGQSSELLLTPKVLQRLIKHYN